MKRIFKESNKVTVLLTLFVFLSLAFFDASARSKEVEETKKRVESIDQTQVLPFPQQRVHRISGVNACMTNWALLGSQMRGLPESPGGCFMENPDSEAIAPSFEFPAGSGLEYLWQGAIWIGAKINDTIYTSVGCDGWQLINELWPDSFPQGAIIERSTISDTPCYSPDAISHQDIIAVYTDTSADIPLSPWQQDPWDNRKHFPLDVRITQKSYSWNIPGFDKFIIAEYIIENIGDYLLSDAYIGFLMDADIMHIDEGLGGPYAYADDITGFLKKYEVFPGDTQEVNIPWAADNDGHGEMDGGYSASVFTDKSPRSVIGMKVLDTPNPDLQISYNWWISSMSGSPYDWGPWKAASQTEWEAMNPYGSDNLFPDNVLGTPGGDVSKYFIMSNGEFDYDQIYSCVWPEWYPDEGWLPANGVMCGDFANGFDTRFLFSFGPFEQLAPGESLSFAVAFVIGETLHVDPLNFVNNFSVTNPNEFYANLNFSNLVQNALTAQILYDTMFTDVEESEIEVPKSFHLSQNQPNPFNLCTIIEYSLKKTSHVSLKIYNVRGEVVRTVVDQKQKPGIHQMIWDGKNQKGKEVASGIYLYKLTADDRSETKKMILLK
ncbi:MAG: T9SS type A sorting domain-containing protein [candidate division Zixibacteria bacterium]|nr:T9SS type A sorting domain-containing protein [candidate division Zixibacteria bacterium]